MSKVIEEIARAMANDQSRRHYGIVESPDATWEACGEWLQAEWMARAVAAYAALNNESKPVENGHG